jgi:hypothetical protein
VDEQLGGISGASGGPKKERKLTKPKACTIKRF